MPLTKRQFELGIDEEMEIWMRQVYELLADNNELAYSHDELGQQVLGDARDMEAGEKLERILDVLVRIRAVERREVAGNYYYAFDEKINTSSWELDTSDF